MITDNESSLQLSITEILQNYCVLSVKMGLGLSRPDRLLRPSWGQDSLQTSPRGPRDRFLDDFRNHSPSSAFSPTHSSSHVSCTIWIICNKCMRVFSEICPKNVTNYFVSIIGHMYHVTNVFVDFPTFVPTKTTSECMHALV